MTLVLLVDDMRTFRDRRDHVRCRTSNEALLALPLLRDHPGAELWLDHDLGEVDGRLDSTLPVLDELARAAFEGKPYPVAHVYVHTSNPSGAETILRVLRRWDYPVMQVVAADELIEESLADPGSPPKPGADQSGA